MKIAPFVMGRSSGRGSVQVIGTTLILEWGTCAGDDSAHTAAKWIIVKCINKTKFNTTLRIAHIQQVQLPAFLEQKHNTHIITFFYLLCIQIIGPITHKYSHLILQNLIF